MTDTGRFQYEATTPATLRMAADAARAPLRPRAARAGPLRGQPARVHPAGRHGARPRSRYVPRPTSCGPISRRRTSRAQACTRRDRRPDRRDPHRAGRRRRRRDQAAEGRPVQGERAFARRARPVAPWRRRSAAEATDWRPATPRSTGPAGTVDRLVTRAARRARRAVTAPGPDGLLLIDKPGGITSHDAVAAVRRALGTKKVGHAGTLDPMATGLLVMGVGRATRLLRFLGDLPKTYEGTVPSGRRDRHAGRRRRRRARRRPSTVDARPTSPAPMAALVGDSMQTPARVLGGEGRRDEALRGRPHAARPSTARAAARARGWRSS